MLKKFLSTTILLSIYLLLCHQIYLKFGVEEPNEIKQTLNNPKTMQEKKSLNRQPIIQESTQIKYTPLPDTSIGTLTINKINLSKKLYSINDPLNNIEKNITILNYSNEPSKDNSIIFIAAHSGTGKLAFFKDLNKLETNDTIELTYKNKLYIYQVKDIWEIKKTGNISVEKEEINQLILTTCSPTKDNYQLIINSILIKKES